jgi:hypothetical protein
MTQKSKSRRISQSFSVKNQPSDVTEPFFLNKNPPFPRGKASCRIHSSGRVGVKKHKYVFGF